MSTEKLINDLTGAGYEVAVGKEATEKMIKDKAGPKGGWLCSGFGVHPDGTKCPGCLDCAKPAMNRRDT